MQTESSKGWNSLKDSSRRSLYRTLSFINSKAFPLVVWLGCIVLRLDFKVSNSVIFLSVSGPFNLDIRLSLRRGCTHTAEVKGKAFTRQFKYCRKMEKRKSAVQQWLFKMARILFAGASSVKLWYIEAERLRHVKYTKHQCALDRRLKLIRDMITEATLLIIIHHYAGLEIMFHT